MLLDYLKEKDGSRILETEGGFLAFAVSGDQFYIRDFYIRSDFRKSKTHFLDLMQTAFSIAKAENCTRFTCHVPVSIQDCSGVLLSRLKFGFRVLGLDGDRIAMELKLEDCLWAIQ